MDQGKTFYIYVECEFKEYAWSSRLSVFLPCMMSVAMLTTLTNMMNNDGDIKIASIRHLDISSTWMTSEPIWE